MPHALYIVDSFGSMQDDEMEQYAQAAEELLDNRIGIGFHGHGLAATSRGSVYPQGCSL